MWGHKKQKNHDRMDEERETHQDQPRGPAADGDADERTSLLPRQPRGEGYLNPDDPAVSPYNLWSVRALRYLNILFLVITFLWWVLLLVSIFVSPPYFHSRGSGFSDVAFTTLSLGNLLLALLFFSVPSKPLEWGSVVIAVILLADTIIILAATRLRAEEGWVGMVSAIWATLMALNNVLTDRVVAWGKGEEEERLTGRKESRRSLREWCAVFTSTFFIILYTVISVLLTATLILRARDAGVAPIGERYYVDGNKYQLHLACMGNFSTDPLTGRTRPTVLLEGGSKPVEDTFDDWVFDAQQNKTIGRYCLYDRPGLGWSDDAPSPHSAGMTSDALSEALARAGEEGPFVLVAAGIGGIYGRIFASRHRADVVGLMLIDALHEDLLYKIGAPSRGFILWVRGVISPLGIDRLLGAIIRGRTPEDRVYGISAYQSGKFIKAKLQENLVANSLTKNEVSQARQIQDDQTPLVIVSSGISTKEDSEWESKQRDLSKITDNLISWDIVNQAPHEVWTTLYGRFILEQRLGELVKGGAV